MNPSGPTTSASKPLSPSGTDPGARPAHSSGRSPTTRLVRTHRGLPLRQVGQDGRHLGRVGTRDQVELDVAVRGGADGEDAGLGERHALRLGRAAVAPEARCETWLGHDVAQCGYRQPGQVLAAVALVRKVRRGQRKIKEKDLDAIRNICRCGTCSRIREAIEQGARRLR